MKEYASSSVSLFQSTRGGTIILSHALWLLLFSCYHDQNHTHYVVEVIEVVVGGGTPPMGDSGGGGGRCHLLAAGTQFAAIAALVLTTLAWPYTTRLCVAAVLEKLMLMANPS